MSRTLALTAGALWLLLIGWSVQRHLRWAELMAALVGVECSAAATAPPSGTPPVRAQTRPELSAPGRDPCVRPTPGSAIPEPRDLRSHAGVLQLNLSIRDYQESDGSVRYCYLLDDGSESPTLRLHPGDLLVLRLKDELVDYPNPAAATQAMPLAQSPSTAPPMAMPSAAPSASVLAMARNRLSAVAMPLTHARPPRDPCSGALMTPVATNLHFHGLTVPARCHEDDVLQTSLLPGEPPFEYRFRIPRDEPPGLYWYHPHIHGYDTPEVAGGASGALIVEGIERAVPQLAGLPERVLVIRDQDLLHPNAPPSKSEPVVPKMLIDRDGESANNGTGFGKPAKDLSINFVPVPYPDYPPAEIRIRPGEHQLWRVVNAATVTYLNLALLYGRAPQRLGIVAIDGVPLHYGDSPAPPVAWVDHIGVPPGARVEFIATGPPLGMPALLVTRTVDSGQGGENDPNRTLASLTATRSAPEPSSHLSAHPMPPPRSPRPWLGDVAPVRVRHLYFSEKLLNPRDPNSATVFFITVDGQPPRAFDPKNGPDIIATQGTVEDWIIENRSTELHAFHIHQLHFELVDWMGLPVHEPFLRDTVNVPYYSGQMLAYPSVRLRMDFRDPNIIGTFVYHCHLFEHSDGGMMGMIRVDPPPRHAHRVAAPKPPLAAVAHEGGGPRS